GLSTGVLSLSRARVSRLVRLQPHVENFFYLNYFSSLHPILYTLLRTLHYTSLHNPFRFPFVLVSTPNPDLRTIPYVSLDATYDKNGEEI
ncbi:hypothetical protein BC938DRAFT_478032, partial [Jimgerdemannia flammicorona]